MKDRKPSDVELERVLIEADKLYQSGCYDSAAEKYEAVAAKDKELLVEGGEELLVWANLGLGNSRGALGEYNFAVEAYSVVVRLDPMYSTGYCNRGYARLILGDVQGAIEDCDKAIELDCRHGDAYITRGNAYSMNGESGKAVVDLQEGLVRSPRKSNRDLAIRRLQECKGRESEGSSMLSSLLGGSPSPQKRRDSDGDDQRAAAAHAVLEKVLNELQMEKTNVRTAAEVGQALLEENRLKDEQIATLKEQLEDKSMELDEALHSLNHRSGVKENWERKFVVLEAQLKDLQHVDGENRSLRERLAEEVEKTAQVKREVRDLQEKCKAMSKITDEIHAELAEARENEALLRDEKKKLKVDLEKLRGHKVVHNTGEVHEASRSQDLSADRELLSPVRSSRRETDEVSELTKEVTRLRMRLAAKDAMASKAKNLESQTGHMQKELEEYRDLLEEKRSEVDALKRDMGEREELFVQIQTEKAGLLARVLDMENVLQEGHQGTSTAFNQGSPENYTNYLPSPRSRLQSNLEQFFGFANDSNRLRDMQKEVKNLRKRLKRIQSERDAAVHRCSQTEQYMMSNLKSLERSIQEQIISYLSSRSQDAVKNLQEIRTGMVDVKSFLDNSLAGAS